jgi:hypothetical protein
VRYEVCWYDLPNKQWEILGIEQLDICNALVGHNLEFASEDVKKASQDEGIRNEGSAAELRKVSDEDKGQKYDQL